MLIIVNISACSCPSLSHLWVTVWKQSCWAGRTPCDFRKGVPMQPLSSTEWPAEGTADLCSDFCPEEIKVRELAGGGNGCQFPGISYGCCLPCLPFRFNACGCVLVCLKSSSVCDVKDNQMRRQASPQAIHRAPQAVLCTLLVCMFAALWGPDLGVTRRLCAACVSYRPKEHADPSELSVL